MSIEIVYYVAASVDGFIAEPDGGVGWLSTVEATGEDYGYTELFSGVDAMVIGSRTYEQVLSFGDWPYDDKPCWVMTRRELDIVGPAVRLSDRSPGELVAELEGLEMSRIWLVGGAEVAGAFRREGLISEYLVSVIPIVLGEGIPLLPPADGSDRLELIGCRRFESGVVNLHYRR